MTSISCPSGIFPSDVLVQILVKLPIRSLFRFKCVCQFMYRLPSEKFFIRLYNENSSKNPMLLVEIIEAVQTQSTLVCVDRFGEFEEFSLDFLKDRVKVRASCNGFLCCASVSNRGVYYVCNPLTKGFRLLPRPRVREVTRYHPDYEATLVGLAFDPCSGKLNVALAGFYRPFGHRPLNQLVCFLFDSETNSWKRFVSYLYDEFTHMNRNQVVFSSGSLHWLTHSCSYILVLDLVNELWTKISLPDEVVAGAIRTRVYLLELEGSVSLIQISGVWMCIWVLMDYVKEKWVMLDQVHLRCILGFAPSVFPISQTRDVVFLAAQKKIFMYRRKDKVWNEIYAMKDTSVYPLWFSAHPYRATLFSCL